MENKKPWYKSKAVLSGVVAIGIAAYNQAIVYFNVPPVPDYVYAILGALGIYGRVTASTTIKR